MQRLLHYPFQDSWRARREIQALQSALPEGSRERVDLLISSSPAPEQTLLALGRLREQQPALFSHVARSAATLQAILSVFAHSRFLTEGLLQYPEWAAELDATNLHRSLSGEELNERLIAQIPQGVPPPLELARFRRRQMLRIAARDVLGLATLAEITSELTALADAILGAAARRIYQDLVKHYGEPRSGEGLAHFSVIAVGKMGGQELNYSSDIDLIYLYSANGETAGRWPISNKEFFTRASNQLTALLSTFTGEGMCYRVDLRLRPDGSNGEVCLSLDSAKTYYEKRARDWELQMLIKARVAAGHFPTGAALLDFVEPLTYRTTLDFTAIEALSVTRERLNEKLRRGPQQAPKRGTDVKLERGGIRDIEFLVQCLQRLHGGADQWVRHGGTLLALARLQDKGYLSAAEYGRLAAAYQFLRQLEHRLQLDEDRQTHTLPDATETLELIAQRMPIGGTAAGLVAEMHVHFDQVREIYERVVHSRTGTENQSSGGWPVANVVLALDQTAPRLAAALSRADLQRGARPFEHFLERLPMAGGVERLDSDPVLTGAMLDLFEHSPHFAEELIRTPELIEDVACAGISLATTEPVPHTAPELRRWYRREMVRIQSESLHQAKPIFDTLTRTSDLADAVIGRAYQIAIAEEMAARPPQDPNYRPENQMFIIAVGRLGLQEFDLASDADLVFVLNDSDREEMPFWTRVAHRLLDLIMAYTGSGVLFAIDARLRPHGNAGPMVQTETAFKDYFEKDAEAWEGITYMKSRVVAGDAEAAGKFLSALQAVDWQRYGQGGRSRTDLRQMRMRLERDQGAAHPFKAGRGGYYDIDFLLMYLRLRSAGVYFKVLNTPARIEVLEILERLSRAQAGFLREAATFYRALDHTMRIISGHAEGKLPKADAQLELVAEVLKRWTPIPLADLGRIRTDTRAMFDRFFPA